MWVLCWLLGLPFLASLLGVGVALKGWSRAAFVLAVTWCVKAEPAQCPAWALPRLAVETRAPIFTPLSTHSLLSSHRPSGDSVCAPRSVWAKTRGDGSETSRLCVEPLSSFPSSASRLFSNSGKPLGSDWVSFSFAEAWNPPPWWRCCVGLPLSPYGG